MTTSESQRQREWRNNQKRQGLEQVRVWVPEKHTNEIKAVAAAMRGTAEAEPPSGKQVYRMKKAEKTMRTRQIPASVKNDRWRLEVWLIQNGF